jgi:hypothetical protein
MLGEKYSSLQYAQASGRERSLYARMPTPRIIRVKAATDQKCRRRPAGGRGEPGKPEAVLFGGG